MTDIYNLTNYTNATNLLELGVATNQLTGGLFFVVVLVLILIISFVAMKRYSTEQAMVSSTFITFLLGAILWMTELISDKVMIVFFIFFVLSAAATLLMRK